MPTSSRTLDSIRPWQQAQEQSSSSHKGSPLDKQQELITFDMLHEMIINHYTRVLGQIINMYVMNETSLHPLLYSIHILQAIFFLKSADVLV